MKKCSPRFNKLVLNFKLHVNWTFFFCYYHAAIYVSLFICLIFNFLLIFLFSHQMIHTFSGCILGSAVECDLDELLATRLVSFLMDHQQNILSVPEYLLNAINDHIQYLRVAQVRTGAVY